MRPSRVVIVASVGEVGSDENSSARGEISFSCISLSNPSFGDVIVALGSIRSGVVTSVPSSLFASILASTEAVAHPLSHTLIRFWRHIDANLTIAATLMGVFIGDSFLEGESGTF